MSTLMELASSGPSATDGEIAAINLESARRAAWTRFAHSARLPGVVEALVDHERLAAQYLGDLDALDRLECREPPDPPCSESDGCDRDEGLMTPSTTVLRN
jgi:hypothetical protein